MIDEKPEIAEAVEAAYELTRPLGRGDILTHAKVAAALGLAPHEGHWDWVVDKVKRRLERERGIAVWAEKNVGYRLLTTDEQLQVPAWRLARSIRQVRRGRRSIEALPANTRGMSTNQRRARAFLVDRMRETEKSLRRQLREQAEEIRPTPTIPRRPIFG